MAILINFVSSQIATFEELVQDKLTACYGAMRFFQNGYFFPQTVELWYDAPSIALGGELRKEKSAQNLFEAYEILQNDLRNIQNQDLRRTIVIFRGVWKIEDIELAGYFSIHNSMEWRKVYGDIEISAYPKDDIEDIVDALWLTNDINGMIDKFIGNLYQDISKLRIAISQVVFCHGIWNKDDPAGIMAILLVGERRGLLRIFYDARRKEKSWDLEPMAKPLDTTFLLDTLEQTKIVEERINERLERDLVAELPAGSKLYIAKQRDSFGKLYDDISNAVIKPALAKLPKDELVRQRIEEGLKDYTEDGAT
jgi:hypothetical protein